MTQKKALILFAHGARDPRWAHPFQKLQKIAQSSLLDTAVELAFLELMEPRLPDVVSKLAEGGCTEIAVVPVFLGQGGHVLRDLPPMIESLRTQYPTLSLHVSNAVGESPEVLDAIAAYCVSRVRGGAD